MAAFDRAELIATLQAARRAVSTGGLLAEYGYFWFTGQDLVAYDGELGIRLPLATPFKCGVPGRTLLDLLGSSALQEIFIDLDKDGLQVQLGKAKIALATYPIERLPWKFPTTPPTNSVATVTLSKEIFVAVDQLAFLKTPKDPTQAYHHGVTFVPQQDCLELYATDSISVAQVLVKELIPTTVAKFVAPWGFLNAVLDLLKPDTVLHIMENCLVAGVDGKLVCTNILELPANWDVSQVVNDNLASLTTDLVALPARLQQTLERAVIVAGKEEALVDLTAKGATLCVEGEYDLGSLTETFAVEGKLASVKGRYPARLILRGLHHADGFALSSKLLMLCGGENFIYILTSKE